LLFGAGAAPPQVAQVALLLFQRGDIPELAARLHAVAAADFVG